MNGTSVGMRLLAIAIVAASVSSGTASAAMHSVPEYLKSAVVYQIVLRNFTRDGDFKAATEMLDHVRSIGVDVVYLTPFVEADRDMDRSGWSKRMKLAGYGSPKNPYRIANYDKVDPEYGTEADFKVFNDKAHALGMKVYMDLVYMHCGPNNVIKDMFPDAFQRNPDGTVRMTQYHFPYVNFKSKGVRKYLIDSMRHWIRLGCDGFRSDVGCGVPLDFWMEAVEVCRKVKPDLVMINEGTDVEYLEKAFDACYAFPFSFALREFVVPETPVRFKGSFYKGETLTEIMDSVRAYEAKVPDNALMFSFADNHDTAFDDGEMRMDRVRPAEAGNALFVLIMLRRGLPLIYNGNEIADSAMNATLAPVEHPLRANKTVDWGRALQPAGQKRLALLRRLSKMRHEISVFSEGTQEWVTDGEPQGAVAFVRRLGDGSAFVAANLTGAAVEFRISQTCRSAAEPLLSENGTLANDGACRLGPWGYVVSMTVNSRKEEKP